MLRSHSNTQQLFTCTHDANARTHARTFCREKKNFGGLDSIGRVCGHECYKRALYELRSLDIADGGPSAVELSELTKLKVDPGEVEQEWWNEGAEDSESLMSRLDELMHQVCLKQRA